MAGRSRKADMNIFDDLETAWNDYKAERPLRAGCLSVIGLDLLFGFIFFGPIVLMVAFVLVVIFAVCCAIRDDVRWAWEKVWWSALGCWIQDRLRKR